ncbi:hypothetical protein [uncultured Neglectibacter sp.]|uniref:hypothetical protein n=1 Tax=uncultured Neglectibacter sp. TaxID=1924108 RepID=UPI0034DE4064
MDNTKFLLACHRVMDEGRQNSGIGTLGEKTLHAVLKFYFDPDPAHHEQKAGSFVADIRNGTGFYEIQTRNFYRLRDKLEAFLPEAPVTVIYPVPALKWLIWLDEDGTATPPRKSPRRGTAADVLPELYAIKPLLNREGLRFCVMLLELEEYRLKNGWSEDGKRGSTRFERLPISLIDELWLSSPADYLKLVPGTLPETFTVKEYGKAAKLSPKRASQAVNVLHAVGALRRTGKVGNAYLYSRTEEKDLT